MKVEQYGARFSQMVDVVAKEKLKFQKLQAENK